MVNIIQDDLLRYMYNELSPEKRLQIQQLLITDNDLRERMDVLVSSKKRLEKIQLLSPDERTLDRIFQYAEKEVEAVSTGE